MRTFFILLFLSTLSHNGLSQRLAPDKYWIPFSNKNQSPYSIHSPEQFLSAASIERRNRQAIPISDNDIPVNPAYIDSLREIGLTVLGYSKWFNAAVVQTSHIDLLNRAKSLSFVLPFDPATAYRLPGGTAGKEDTTNINSESKGFFNGYEYGDALKQIDILQGRGLHELGFTGQGLKIAVFDAGFFRVDSFQAFSHLRDENRVLGTKDFVNPNGNIFNESAHGMSVLSTMAAYLPGIIIGTAPKASYWLLRTEDAGSEFLIEEANWLMAAEFADSAGADIITGSLGYYQFDDTAMNYSYPDMNGLVSLSTRAADLAFSKGMIVISSAGNEGNKAWGKITAPADAFNIITVGAIDTSLNLASFSSRGPSSDGRVKPDLLAVGYQTVLINSSGRPGTGNGTSYAAPQIAGLTACLWQAMPMKKNMEIIHAMKQTADSYSSADNSRGYGIPDFKIAFNYLNTHHYEDNRVVISPNPYSPENEYLSLTFDIKIERIEIINIEGQLVASFPARLKPYEKGSLKINGIAPGVYLLTGRNKSQMRTTRLIVK